MLKSVELRKKVSHLKNQVNKLKKEADYENALKVAEELKQVAQELKATEAEEAAEKVLNVNEKGEKSMDKKENVKMMNRIFNKKVLGKALDEKELEFYNAAGTPAIVEATDAKGGYIVPEENLTTVREYLDSMVSLKNYCGVRTVSTNKGKMPTLGGEDKKLVNFDEVNDINKSDIDFGQISYSVASYGDVIPVSNELLADTDVDLMNIIGRRFAKKAINTENAKIMEILGKLPAVEITDYKGIISNMVKSLNPAIVPIAKVFTNQKGFAWLATLEDGDNRPLLVPDVIKPEAYEFRGHEVVVVPDSTYSEEGKIPFFVGSMTEAVAFFDRQLITVAADSSAGFAQNATYFRAIERFDVVADNTKAMIHLTVAG